MNMKRKLSTILTVLVIAVLTISTADAGGGIKIPSANFSLGSLIADGFLQGTGQTTVTVVLEATGTCNTVQVSAIGFQILSGNEEEESEAENTNKRPFHVETNNPGDCNNDPGPNDSFVFWTQATISVFSGDITQSQCSLAKVCAGLLSSAITTSNPLLVEQDYNCRTNQDAHTVSCTPIKKNGSNKGTVAICHATGNKKNPYVLLTVNVNGLNGHGKHTNDIIPAPADGCPN
jgi:hypothetical protein